ncbi:MAG TPA: hypothetical protein VK072_07940 [Candidatus Avamphibacillus sp.]|nr:hypothetical protein [Candidatus Avamphibacillus sp.]
MVCLSELAKTDFYPRNRKEGIFLRYERMKFLIGEGKKVPELQY